jgi:1,4-dihydroxy-2-naphthoyl-CoA hydrolase
MSDLTPPSELLDAEYDEITATRVSGTVAADERHHQPWGIVQGGLYAAVIETFATAGAFEADVAVPIQQGRTQQLRQIEIRRPQDDKLVARGQVRLQNIETPPELDLTATHPSVADQDLRLVAGDS